MLKSMTALIIIIIIHSENSEKAECGDYIEFGQNDLIPFLTVKRSGRLCNYKPGLTFDEPEGELLIWLHLGSLHSGLRTSRLSLVITPYSTNKNDHFNKKCRK